MAEKQKQNQRTTLGRLDYKEATPYDLAVVLVDYIQSPQFLGEGIGLQNVVRCLELWGEERTRQASPELYERLCKLRDNIRAVNDDMQSLARHAEKSVEPPGMQR